VRVGILLLGVTGLSSDSDEPRVGQVFRGRPRGRQVPTQFATEGALNRDGLKRKLPDAGWNIAAASLARDNECLAISGCREHASIIGNTLGNYILDSPAE
jgi:hypothetical protein